MRCNTVSLTFCPVPRRPGGATLSLGTMPPGQSSFPRSSGGVPASWNPDTAGQSPSPRSSGDGAGPCRLVPRLSGGCTLPRGKVPLTHRKVPLPRGKVPLPRWKVPLPHRNATLPRGNGFPGRSQAKLARRMGVSPSDRTNASHWRQPKAVHHRLKAVLPNVRESTHECGTNHRWGMTAGHTAIDP